jgi:TolA-binding protein|tara:strand:- start:123 stop:374 length:252 start_codon:yes stop_codon:yes gene_type:complete
MTKQKNPQNLEELAFQLAPEEEWEDEGGSVPPTDSELSDLAISYLAQIQDLQEQLDQENLKIQRLEMAIKGFTVALQEEIKGL